MRRRRRPGADPASHLRPRRRRAPGERLLGVAGAADDHDRPAARSRVDQDHGRRHVRIHEGSPSQRVVRRRCRSSTRRPRTTARSRGRFPPGTRRSGVFLKTDVDRTYGDKWQNTIRVTTSPPGFATTPRRPSRCPGPLASGVWLNQSQPVNLTVDAGDAGAGVAAASLRDGATGARLRLRRRRSPATQPGRTAYSGTLGTSPAALGDGMPRAGRRGRRRRGRERRRRRSRSRSTPTLPRRSR